MINYIKSATPADGAEALAKKISSILLENKSVLWLICGGSNLPIAVEILQAVRESVSAGQLQRLTVMQTDERYGPVGHADSNWQQLLDLGFNLKGLASFPILKNLPLEQTALEYSIIADKVFSESNSIIGQFGLGTDGHIAGILPHSIATKDGNRSVVGYESRPFVRLTLTPPMLQKISVSYVFVFGESKREAVTNLQTKELSLGDEPCQILKKMKEVYFYSDLV
jgi:6-phosphogluconolactonase/glucosamine-6-phosphate isomerase/deaminase